MGPTSHVSIHPEKGPTPGLLRIFLRGASMQCPRCGRDSLYKQWNVLKTRCESCGYALEEREGNCWFFLYSTTAALTGLFIIVILLVRPANVLAGRVILGAAATLVIVFSLPLRKGIALALEYLSEREGGHVLLYEDDPGDGDEHNSNQNQNPL